jgi:hypothetical protein
MRGSQGRVVDQTVRQEQAMPEKDRRALAILCPSVTGIGPAVGVLTGSVVKRFRVGYLTMTLPATSALLAAAAPARPRERLRAAALCMGRHCEHFHDANCRRAARIASLLDPFPEALPRCAVHRQCRWLRQEGRAACLRCPQVTAEQRNPSDLQSMAAD